MARSMVAAIAAGSGVLVLATASSHADIAYSFTSGSFYDGFNWPSYQQARQSDGGLLGDQFNTPDGVAFNNFSGNLAFFDANNLRTAPARYINNDAWWTDVRLKPFTGGGDSSFEMAAFDIGFSNTASGYVDRLGFDAALVVMGSTTPSQVYYSAYDTQGNGASGYLDFTDSYSSLGGAGTGREGRFTIDSSALGLANIRSVHINLASVANPAGNTQFALDNFWTNAATPPEPDREIITYIPSSHVPADTPHTFVYADVADGDHQTGVDVSDLSAEDVLQARISTIDPTNTGGPGSGLDAKSYTTGASIYTPVSSVEQGVYAHEVTHTVQSRGPAVEVGVQYTDPPIGSDDALMQAISIDTALGSDQQDWGNAFSEHIGEGPQIMDDSSDVRGSFHATFEPTSGTDPAPLIAHEAMMMLGLVETDASSFYLNYTFEDYMAFKAAQAEAWIVGDNGASIRPLLDEQGEFFTWSVNTWIVTDGGGTMGLGFTPVPEPGTAGLMAVVAGALLRRRR